MLKSSLRAKRSNPKNGLHRFLDCFVALRAPRNDGHMQRQCALGSAQAISAKLPLHKRSICSKERLVVAIGGVKRTQL
jgi:hypothetical protein